MSHGRTKPKRQHFRPGDCTTKTTSKGPRAKVRNTFLISVYFVDCQTVIFDYFISFEIFTTSVFLFSDDDKGSLDTEDDIDESNSCDPDGQTNESVGY